MVINKYNLKSREKFQVEPGSPCKWKLIHKLFATEPRKITGLTWQKLLPKNAQALAEVIEEITDSSTPYEHQEQAIRHLISLNKKKKDLIINGGTFSGKSLSFIVPSIVKLLNKETDFIAFFYPSKQLLLDQFERVKEYLVKFWEKTGIRLTCDKYSGDTGKSNEITIDQELQAVEQNPPNILLGTFDKVWYQIQEGNNNPLIEKMKKACYLVFDEIHAFDGYAAANIRGFIDVHKKINPGSQVVLSSATIADVEVFRDDFLPTARIITCPPVRGEQEFVGTTIEHTISLLVDIWKDFEKKPGKVCLVFLDSKEDIELLTKVLCQKLKDDCPFFDSATVEMIHADLPYHHRKKILDEIRKGNKNIIKILIASSVLELGVNIPNIQTVINIGIPITQKDGIVQRMARNRSVPGERRANAFIFDLSKKRDSFYWNNIEMLKEIIETNACNPILYPKLNPKIMAGQIILHLRYGINDIEKIMQFFLKQGNQYYQVARQQYTKFVTLGVLKKGNDGKIMFTSKGEEKLKVQAKKKNQLVPFSIRAIKNNWSIKMEMGSSNWNGKNTSNLGKISSRDVLWKGLPDNIITRNKEQYIVTDFDRQLETIYVKKLLSKEKNISHPFGLTNRLLDPQITSGIFAKKAKGTDLMDIRFGQVFIKQQPFAICNSNSDKIGFNKSIDKSDGSSFWQELSRERSEELAITEESDGIIFSLKSDFVKSKELTIKKLLDYFGKVLQIEVEVVLSIPSNEFALAFNTNQLAVYDKGNPNGNSEYLFVNLQKTAEKALKRLTNCSCTDGCKNCYGEILGLFPKGLKESLKVLFDDLTRITEMELAEELLSEINPEQMNFKENKIIAFSDIHLTNMLCYQEEFYEALKQQSKQADIIIINGDLLDTISEESYQAFNEFKKMAIKEGFWSKLVLIRSSSIHDGNLEEFTGFLHQDYVEVEVGSEHVVFVHGNKVGLDASIIKDKGVESAALHAKQMLISDGRLWLPDIRSETHLVFGHLHTRFYNERYRVYGLGHWTRKGNPYHQQCIMILSSSFQDTLKLFSYTDLRC